MADASANPLKTLEKHLSCSSLICNIYEHDKSLLDCFENFYSSKKRVITIYRLLEDKMGFCSTGLYFVFPPVIFYCTSLFRRPLHLFHCLWMVIQHLFAYLSPEGTDNNEDSRNFFLFRKVLVEFLMQSIHWSKTKLSGLLLSKRKRGSRLVCLIEDASYFLSVDQMPFATSVWVEKHKTSWIWACECFFPCEKSYYRQILFHYPKWTQVQPHRPGLWVEFASPIF